MTTQSAKGIAQSDDPRSGGVGRHALGSMRLASNRMKAKFALLIKGGAITQERAYALASQAVGRTLTPGFGLSTCSHSELIKILDAVTGKAQSAERRAPAPERHALTAMRHAPNVVRIATVGQLQRAASLERELKIGMDEAAGIARRATGVAHPRTAGQVGKYTEALKAIRTRRQRAAGSRQEA